MPSLETYESCNREGEEPTSRNGCLAQCFHIAPDVFFLHLHTTAGVQDVRHDLEDSGLGPAFNASEAGEARLGYGRYNVCACEPREWGDRRGRGSCPVSRPSDPEYVAEAVVSLCRNLAGVMEIEPSICRECRRPNLFDES